MRPVIFLSHWHEDSEQANWLSDELRRSLAHLDVEIFSTSAPASRCENFNPQPGSNWEAEYHEYVEALRAYLRDALEGAAGYLLLLTGRSLARESAWVRFEIRHGTQLAKERGIPFVPCLLGVSYEALLRDPPGATLVWPEFEVGERDDLTHPEAEFQAVHLDEPAAIPRLVNALETQIQAGRGVPPTSPDALSGPEQ